MARKYFVMADPQLLLRTCDNAPAYRVVVSYSGRVLLHRRRLPFVALKTTPDDGPSHREDGGISKLLRSVVGQSCAVMFD